MHHQVTQVTSEELFEKAVERKCDVHINGHYI